MEKQNNVPRLRFPVFEGEWEKKKLGEEFKKVNERNDGSFGKNHWISVAKMYYQAPEKVQSNNLDTRTYVMRLGDIAFEGNPNSEFMYGRFVVNDIGAGIISELFPIYRHIRDYNNDYWKYAIQIERIMRPIYAKAITSSGASSNKLNEEHFLRESILVPTVEEQTKIGEYFRILDNFIFLHQRKLDQMKEYKKGMLQKMFPKNGETVPEIRFPGFAGDWEPCSLENVVSIMGGNAWKSSDYKLGGKFLVITIANVSGDININENVGNYIDCDDHSVFVLHKNDILVSLTGNVGRVSKMTGIPAVLNQRVAKIIPKTDSIISDFLFHIMHNSKFEKAMIECGQGAAQKNISNKDILCYDFLMPLDKKEQMAIANYFNNLDELITLHQYKLEEMKEYKKGLLQQMFV